METQNEIKPTREENMSISREDRLLGIYQKLMQSKRETQAEIRSQANNPEFWKAVEPLLKRNAERGTPFV